MSSKSSEILEERRHRRANGTSLRRVRAITQRLLQQFRRDRRTLALLFVAPLVILALLGYLLRGGGSVPKMGVVNLDAGPLGGVVASAVERSSSVSASAMSQPDAESQLRSATIAGYLVLPANFSVLAQQSRVVAPEIHLEGTQPGLSATVVQAVSQSFTTLAGQVGGIRFAPAITYRYGGTGFDTLDYFGAGFIGLVVFFLVFVITAVAFLRERSQGTLERLMASPLRRPEIVVGYMLGFTALALVQAVEVLAFCLLVLHVHNSGNVLLIFVMEALMAIFAVNLGIFLSMFARTEFQAVQFIPLVIVPQMLLSGIIFPVSTEPRPLQILSDVLPLTYAVEGMRNIMIKGADLTWSSLQLDLAVVIGFCLLVIIAGATTLRRRIA
jgi:ABC-2 type transport system permease protein